MLGSDKEFVNTKAKTHSQGFRAVYQCSDLSVIPLIYPGTPPYLVLKCFVHYLLRSFKQKILMEKYWIGSTLFGPENVAIIRVRFIILTTATFWSIYIVFYLQANPLNMAFFHGEKATSFIDLMKENKYILLHLVVPISTMVINIALVIYLAVVQHKVENSVQIFVIFGEQKSNCSKSGRKILIFCIFNGWLPKFNSIYNYSLTPKSFRSVDVLLSNANFCLDYCPAPLHNSHQS